MPRELDISAKFSKVNILFKKAETNLQYQGIGMLNMMTISYYKMFLLQHNCKIHFHWKKHGIRFSLPSDDNNLYFKNWISTCKNIMMNEGKSISMCTLFLIGSGFVVRLSTLSSLMAGFNVITSVRFALSWSKHGCTTVRLHHRRIAFHACSTAFELFSVHS